MPDAISRLKIICYPDPRLRVRCKPVEKVDADLRRVAERMIELMHEARGVGLAAPQIGLSARLFVCQVAEESHPRVFFNPLLTPEAESETADEGCLSIPEVTVAMRRARRCTISGLDQHGRPVRAAAEGLLARVWQHECDHLDGRLIIDRMNESEKIANRRVLKQLERDFKASSKPRRKRG
jgi:peptide deformylase